ncbi:radical SAM protein [Streptomyces abikoensis]|uniref:radical SAM protein n=1 Tax=Streptomyces abikoensis TaxID=97398 RepID=UPI0033D17599
MPSVTQAAQSLIRPILDSVECELTEICDLECSHCCTLSGPRMTHGTMDLADWQEVIDHIADLGIPMVQFIGGEPTRSPHLPALIEYSLGRDLGVEVYSNLTHIRPSLWGLFAREGVRLATSYYSDEPAEHDSITNGTGSHARTRTAITEALRRGIPLRVGIVKVLPGQRVCEAAAELRALGVTDIRTDHVRKVGRAADPGVVQPDVTELCGRCFHQRAAISPSGDMYGCILSRHLLAGNVKAKGLAAVLTSDRWAEITATVPAPRAACTPDDSNDCDPASTPACLPSFPDDEEEE